MNSGAAHTFSEARACSDARRSTYISHSLMPGLLSQSAEWEVHVQSKDAERIRDFLVQHTPHKIFLGGACMQCVQLYEDLQKVLDHMLDRMPSAFTRTETGYIELNWADESLAALWETSESASRRWATSFPLCAAR